MKQMWATLALALLMTSGAIAAEITDKTRCSEFVATSNVYDKATKAGCLTMGAKIWWLPLPSSVEITRT